jgi:hypothetical protein
VTTVTAQYVEGHTAKFEEFGFKVNDKQRGEIELSSRSSICKGGKDSFAYRIEVHAAMHSLNVLYILFLSSITVFYL